MNAKPIGLIHGFECFEGNAVEKFHCPIMRVYGFKTVRALSRYLAGVRRRSDAQSQLCKEYASKLTTP